MNGLAWFLVGVAVGGMGSWMVWAWAVSPFLDFVATLFTPRQPGPQGWGISPEGECLHNDAGEGDWCYLCWTNVKTGETYEEAQERQTP